MRKTIGNPWTYHPKPMFQLSAVHCNKKAPENCKDPLQTTIADVRQHSPQPQTTNMNTEGDERDIYTHTRRHTHTHTHTHTTPPHPHTHTHTRTIPSKQIQCPKPKPLEPTPNPTTIRTMLTNNNAHRYHATQKLQNSTSAYKDMNKSKNYP